MQNFPGQTKPIILRKCSPPIKPRGPPPRDLRVPHIQIMTAAPAASRGFPLPTPSSWLFTSPLQQQHTTASSILLSSSARKRAASQHIEAGDGAALVKKYIREDLWKIYKVPSLFSKHIHGKVILFLRDVMGMSEMDIMAFMQANASILMRDIS